MSDTSPTEFLEQAEGQTPADILKKGIGGWLLALSAAFISGTQTLVEFLFLPFEVLGDATWTSAEQFLFEPMGITTAGAEETAAELAEFGLFGLPVSVLIAIGTLAIVVWVSARGYTGLFPGSLVDWPFVGLFFTTPEEEEEDS